MLHLPELLNALLIYALLSIAIAHFAWVMVESELMRPYRSWLSGFGLMFSYMTHCVICTTTQLSILFCWVAGVYPFNLEGWLFPISYLASSLLLAKTSLVLGSLFELPPYLAGLCLSISRYLDSITYEVPPHAEEQVESTDRESPLD